MKAKASKTIKYLLSLLLAGALLYFAFRGTDFKDFFEGLKTTDWGYVMLSLVPAIMALIFRAERWRLQLITLDTSIKRIEIWDASNIANFLSIIIPGVGEFYRCGHISTAKARYDKTLGTIVMERAWDVLAIFSLLILALLLGSDKLLPFMHTHILEPFSQSFSFSFWWIILLAIIFAIGAIVAIFSFRNKYKICNKCADAICGILQGFTSFGQMKGKLLFILYTIGIWLSYIFMAYFTMLAVPGTAQLSLSDAIFISAIGNIASVIPTPGNLGAYHYLVGIAISSIFLGAEEILAAPLLFATLSHGSHAILLIILAIFSYIALTVRRNGVSK